MVLMRAALPKIEAVYRARGADFFRLALARTGDAEQAQDAVQEGFAHAIRGRMSFRGDGSLEAWVARCVMNAAHDAARAQAHPAMAMGDQDEAESKNDAKAEASSTDSLDPAIEVVRKALRGLPQRQRDALFLRHYLDFDYAAIAQTLGIEVGTVSATLHNARASLADNLQEVAR
jgi:RNA polymerase sigma factor (sigma-70 family)